MAEGFFPPRCREKGNGEIGFLSLPEIDPHYRVTLTTQEQERGWDSTAPRGGSRPSMAQWCWNEAWMWGRMRASMGLELAKVGQRGRGAESGSPKALGTAVPKQVA